MHITLRGFQLIAPVLLSLGLGACRTHSGTGKAVGHTFKNPVYPHNFADPFVLKAGATYYAYATNTDNVDIPTLRSRDLVHWTVLPDAFPVAPRWVAAKIWAPAVYPAPNGRFVLYYSGQAVGSGRECLGRAVSSSPSGPFIDRSTKPFLCQQSLGGDIDPDVVRDTDGKVYLFWKNDGNSYDLPTYLFGQRLSTDGLSLVGSPVKLLRTDFPQDWEGSHVEAPSMWKQSGKYYLFFSANDYSSPSYAVGYATCIGPLGPCKEAPGNPILTSQCNASGPGGETIVTDATGQTWMLYAAWRTGDADNEEVGRRLWLDRLDWKNGRPVVHGPTCTAQPGPAT